MGNDIGDFTLEDLQSLFDEDVSTNKPESEADTKTTEDDITKTQAFAKRLSEKTAEVTESVKAQTREEVAKQLGYESYNAMLQEKENKALTDKGLDPETVSPIVNELVESKLKNDPRMKELDELRKEKIKQFGKTELAEITKLTGGEITSLSQLPKEVIDLWTKKGSLKSAYLELEGEKLITKIRSEQSKGTTDHLANLQGQSPAPSGERFLTDEEKRMFKLFNPEMTDEELNKRTIKK